MTETAKEASTEALLLTTDKLVKEYRQRRVVNGVSISVAAGEIVALRGSNGAGKTTLLRILATLLRPNAGELRLFGVDVRKEPMEARRRLGWVGHDTACYPDLTGRENLEFHAALHQVDGARVDEVLDWSALAGAADRPLRTYSRGMAQRLGLARALLHRPRLLLLDEPFSGLDLDSADRLTARLRALRDDGTAVVLSTHDTDRTAALADRTATIARGRLAWS